jgi:hypothetical protein
MATKDPIALAKLRRERAFSSPAPKSEVKAKPTSYNRFGMDTKDREVDTPTKIFGGIASVALPDPAMIKQAIDDPSGTLRGGAEVVSLANPTSYGARIGNIIRGRGPGLYGASISDIEQALEIAGLIPTGKAASISLSVARKTTPEAVRAGGNAMESFGTGVIRGSWDDAAERMAAIPVQRPVGGGGTAGYTVNVNGKVGSRAKLRTSSQGTDQQRYNTLLMRDRVRGANKRATKVGAGTIDLSNVKQTGKEMSRLISAARNEFPELWQEKGLSAFDLAHITPLEQGGKNAFSNLRLMPRELNAEQGTDLFSVWRNRGSLGDLAFGY